MSVVSQPLICDQASLSFLLARKKKDAWSQVTQPLNLKAEGWKGSEKSYTLDSTNQERWTVLQRERLIHLDLLTLTYDCEFKHLVFCYKALYGYIDIDISLIMSVRVRFFKKILDWILESERIWKRISRFFTKQINPSFRRSRSVKGTEEWIPWFLWRTMIRKILDWSV